MVSVVHQPEARLDEPFARQGARSRLYGIRQRDSPQGSMNPSHQVTPVQPASGDWNTPESGPPARKNACTVYGCVDSGLK